MIYRVHTQKAYDATSTLLITVQSTTQATAANH